MRKIILLVGVFFVVGVRAESHPFYLSLCKVDYNISNHSLEISLKIFADDLLSVLENKEATRLYLGEDKENPKTDEYILNYLKNSLNFSVDGKKMEYTFIGKEMESNAVWIYMEIQDVASLHKIEVDCNLLTDVFVEQNNIIQVNKAGKTKNILLNKQTTNGEITFN